MSEPTSGAAEAGTGTPGVQARPILTTRTSLALRVLGDDDLVRVHADALRLLGAEGTAAEAAARSAPAGFVLGGRIPEHEVALGAGRIWLAAGAATAGAAGVPERVRRLAGGDPEPAVSADLDDAVRLADALPEVGVLAGPPLRVAGVSPPAALARCLVGSSKHVMAGLIESTAEAEAAVEMAVAVAGSSEGARRRPPLSLCGGPEALEAALVFARVGLPVGLVLPPDGAGETTPPGAAGLGDALVRHHAGVMCGPTAPPS